MSRIAIVSLGIVVTAIAVIAVGSHRYQERMTQEAFSMLPLEFSITRTTTNSVGQPAATYFPVANGGEAPYPTYCFIPPFVRIENGSIIQYAQVIYYYDAPTPASQRAVVRKPSATEAGWVRAGRPSPRSGDTPRYVLEFHLVNGNIPAVNTTTHGKFGEW